MFCVVINYRPRQKARNKTYSALQSEYGYLFIGPVPSDAMATSVSCNNSEQISRAWQMLFAITFWDVYCFEDQSGNCAYHEPTTEFYLKNETQIHDILKEIFEPKTHKIRFLKKFLITYNKSQKIFNWSNDCMNACLKLIEDSPSDVVKDNLLKMLTDSKYHPIVFAERVHILENKIHKAKLDKAKLNEDSPDQIYVVLDVETTGGLAGPSKITEIGAVKICNSQIIDTFNTLVNPMMQIPANITRLTGINNEMVLSAPVFKDIASELKSFLQGCIFVAHNVRFDYGFIQKEFRLIKDELNLSTLCTVALSRKKYKGLRSYSLKNLCSEFEINLCNHHHAFADAVAAAQVFAQCMGSNDLWNSLNSFKQPPRKIFGPEKTAKAEATFVDPDFFELQ